MRTPEPNGKQRCAGHHKPCARFCAACCASAEKHHRIYKSETYIMTAASVTLFSGCDKFPRNLPVMGIFLGVRFFLSMWLFLASPCQFDLGKTFFSFVFFHRLTRQVQTGISTTGVMSFVSNLGFQWEGFLTWFWLGNLFSKFSKGCTPRCVGSQLLMSRSKNTWVKYLYLHPSRQLGQLGIPVLNQDTLAAWWIFVLYWWRL